MKKYIFGAVFSLVLLASPAFTQAAALTSSQISAIVALLQSFGADQTTINNVEISLNGGTTTGGGTGAWCHTFNNNLGINSSGEEVSLLQTALVREGVMPSTNWSNGVFDEDTATGVVSFQAKYGIRQTGYVGPRTRAKLNALYGCSNTTPSSISFSLSPTSVLRNQSYQFTANISGAPANSPIAFHLTRPDGSVYYSAQTGFITDTEGNAIITHNVAIGNTGQDGQWNAWVTVDDTWSNRQFVNVSSTATQPSITVLSPNGGEILTPGATQTIKWQSSPAPAYDVGVFPYSDPRCPGNVCTLASGISGTSYNWQVGWANLPGGLPNGTYQIRVCQTGTSVCDASDGSFQIGNQQNTPSIIVLSPNGGENFQLGSTQFITWAPKDSGKTYGISLTDANGFGQGTIATVAGIAADRQGYSWNIGQVTVASDRGDIAKVIIPGVYKIQIINTETGLFDSSDAPFSIVAAGTTTVTPVTFTSISPASGPVGTSIRLDGCGSDSSSGFTLYYSGPKSGTAVIPVETLGAASGCGYMTITVPSDFPAGAYTLSVKNNQTGAMSTNSEAFTVTSNYYPATLSISPTSFVAGSPATITVANAAPYATVKVFCRDPNNIVCDDPATYTMDALGRFTHTYDTTGWTAGTYRVWVTANNVTPFLSWRSVDVGFTVTAPIVANNPVASVSPTSFVAGANFTASITGAAPNATIHVFSTGPDGVTSEDLPAGTTDSSGRFSRTHVTTGWATGTYQGWVTVNGVQSNVVTFTVTAPTPTLTVSPTSFAAGALATITVANAAAGNTVKVFCRDPNNAVCDDPAAYTTDASGRFTHTYNTTGWTIGTYRGWVTVNGAQLNTVTFTVGNVLGASTFTYVWNRDLQIGSPYADDVTALQKALTLNGEYAGELTGGFYNQTYTAVKAFQEKYGIHATGYVGPLTRAQLNNLFAR